MAPMDAAPDTAGASTAGATNVAIDPPLSSATLEAFDKLREKLKALRPNEDLAPLDKAFRFAARLHAGQMRKSGEPYLMHPLAVTDLLVDQQMDMACLVTGLLHDVVEDTPISLEELRRQFGDEVARCVDG